MPFPSSTKEQTHTHTHTHTQQTSTSPQSSPLYFPLINKKGMNYLLYTRFPAWCDIHVWSCAFIPQQNTKHIDRKHEPLSSAGKHGDELYLTTASSFSFFLLLAIDRYIFSSLFMLFITLPEKRYASGAGFSQAKRIHGLYIVGATITFVLGKAQSFSFDAKRMHYIMQ